MILIRERYIGQKERRGDLWIDPKKVTHYCGSRKPVNRIHRNKPKLLRKLLNAFPSNSFSGDWDLDAVQIEEMKKFRYLKDYVECNGDYRKSNFYESMLKELRRKGFVRHKKLFIKNDDELNLFFETHMNMLFFTMRDKGYVMHPEDDVGAATIDRHGRILKASGGDHRFFFARILGVESVPVRIYLVHDKWLEKENISLRRADRGTLIERIHEIGRLHAGSSMKAG